MTNHMKVTLIFDAGKEIGQPDLEAVTDGIIDLLTAQFPDHSGTFMSVFPVDEDGDPIK